MRKNYWKKILTYGLQRDPGWFSNDSLHKKEHRNDFLTKDNIIVVIKSVGNRRNSFGGPIYSAAIQLGDIGITVTFLSGKNAGKRCKEIRWNDIKKIQFSFSLLKN